MNTYKRHRFPPDIISYAVWLYYRFNLSHRDIEVTCRLSAALPYLEKQSAFGASNLELFTSED